MLKKFKPYSTRFVVMLDNENLVGLGEIIMLTSDCKISEEKYKIEKLTSLTEVSYKNLTLKEYVKLTRKLKKVLY